MFFESTYLPSPQLPTRDLDDSVISDILPPTKEESPLPDLDAIDEMPVNHLVFVIHGIGQQTEQSGYFYENIKNLQETTRQVLQAKMPDRDVRIELVPIEWHRHIHDQVDPTMNRITLKTIPTIRFIENDYLADVLFYFTKDRGQSIIDNVTQLFNSSYHNFMEKHPEFDGKILILGYSLGGILIWDILSHQRKPSSIEEELDYGKLDIVYGRLDFKPDYFFSLGSPIAAVLTIRNQSPATYHPDHDIIFQNMFHPFDPLAYRMEPLFDDYYTYQPATLVERSVPIGPTFSFPSLPSFSSIDLLSFFSWKMPSSGNTGARSDSSLDPDTTTINHNDSPSTNDYNGMDTYDTTYTMNHKQLLSLSSSKNEKSAHHHSHMHRHNASTTTQDSGHLLEKGIMYKLFKYFGKHRGDKDSTKSTADEYNTKNSISTSSPTTTTSTASITSDRNKVSVHQMSHSNKATHGIITWDPLQEQRNAVLSTDGKSQGPFWKSLMEASDLKMEDSSNKGGNTHLTRSISSMSSSSSTLTSTTITNGRGARQRSKTYGAQTSSNGNGESIKWEPDMDTITKNQLEHTIAIGNDNDKTGKASSTYFRHLVNALGLDSVGMEGASFNFTRQRNHTSNKHLQRQDINQAMGTDANKDQWSPSIVMGDQAAAQGLGTVDDVIIYSTFSDQVAENPDNSTTGTEPVNSLIMETSNDSSKMEPHQELKEAEKLTAPMSMDDDTNPNTRTKQQHALKHLPGHRRMDFSLQPDGLMSMIANEYLVGLRAHFSYWTSKDLMWHILQALEK